MFKLDRTNALTLVISSEIACKFWCIAFFVVLAYNQIQPYLVIKAVKQKEKTIILTQTGEMIYSETQDWEKSTELFKEVGKLATKCVTMRNPAGFDDQSLIDRLFGESAKEKLKKEFESSFKDFKDKNIHQKALISEWSILEQGKMDVDDKELGKKVETSFVEMELKGQITRNGFQAGLPFKQALDFTVKLTMVRNNNLMKNSFLPLKVADYTYTEQAL